MNGPESKFWVYIREGMLNFWRANRIESGGTSEGIPDVRYAIPKQHGWIELKVLKEFPKRDTTTVKIKHYTDIQKKWIKDNGELAGDVWLFIKVGKEYFLFDWLWAQKVNELTEEQWRKNCIKHWSNRIDFYELYQVLKAGCPGIYGKPSL